MGYQCNFKGIVIKEVNTGEADKIITVLTGNAGKISAAAKNARRTKNPLAAGTQLLCYSDFMLFKGKELYNISGCDVLDSFYEIRNDIVKLTYCSHILELIEDNIQENEPSHEILQLLLNTLYVIAKTDKPVELVTRIFEIRLMALLGYEPNVAGCINCGKDDEEGMYFDFDSSSVVCPQCFNRKGRILWLEAGSVKALKYIIHINPQKLFSFSLSENLVKQLGDFSKNYINEHIGKSYNKLEYLNTLKNF